MPVYGKIGVNIIDLETSGNLYLSKYAADVTLYQYITTNFSLQNLNPSERYSMPVLMRGLGTSLTKYPTGGRVLDPILEYEINGVTGRNDNWNILSYSGQLTGYGLNPASGNESAATGSPFFGGHSVYVKDSGGFTFSKKGRLDLFRLTQPEFQEIQSFYSGSQAAWISYDVTSGVNSRRVFSYSIDIIQQLSGHLDNENSVIEERQKGSELRFYSGKQNSSFCDVVDLVLDTTGSTCEAAFNNEDEEPIEVCLSGDLTQSGINQQISSILSLLTSGRSKLGTVQSDYVDNSEVSIDRNSLSYKVYEGIIDYNDPISGDYIEFRSYSFQYTGVYSGIYGQNPPYAEIKKRWTCGIDYTNLTGLVNKINQDLSSTGYYLWHRDICGTSRTGYFEFGSLLTAIKSGENSIFLQAQRIGSAGAYEFSFFETDRISGVKPSQNSVKYLLPRNITFQGANTYGTWINIDSRTNLNWDSLRPTIKLVDLLTGFTGVTTGVPNAPTPDSFGVSGGPVRSLVYEGQISGKNLCGNDFSKRVEFYQLPQGFSCNQEDEEQNVNIQDALNNATQTISGNKFDVFILKTGFKFNNPNEYNYYRVLIDNFQAYDRAQVVRLSNSFIVSNITLFGYETGTSALSGAMCSYGATYTGQVKGYTTGIITGTLTGRAVSGRVCWQNELVTGLVGDVIFRNSTGKGVSAFSGLVSACVSGTGFYSEEVEGFYYNIDGGCVEFTKLVSGLITGIGTLSGGPYRIIRDSVIGNLTGTQYVVSTGYTMMTGLIPNLLYPFSNLPAFTLITGTKTGSVGALDFGVLNVDELVTINPTTVNSFILSGTSQSKGILNYNTPESGDSVTINGVPIIYSPDTGSLPPTYFKSISELMNIINSGSSNFLVTGGNSATRIFLTGIYSGTSGNGISLSSDGSATKPTFVNTSMVSGVDFYYQLNALTPFTGQLTTGIKATQIKTIIPTSGTITGNIKQLDFVRYFTGIWNIQTGLVNFQVNQWITGGNRYQNSGFESLAYYSGNPVIFPVQVYYTNSPLVFSTDMARLTITGYDVATGISILLSGLA